MFFIKHVLYYKSSAESAPKVYINLIFHRAQQKRKIYSACTSCTVSLYVASVFEILGTGKNFSGSLDFVKQYRGLGYPATSLV